MDLGKKVYIMRKLILYYIVSKPQFFFSRYIYWSKKKSFFDYVLPFFSRSIIKVFIGIPCLNTFEHVWRRATKRMFQIDFGSVDHLEQPFITSPWCEGLHSVRILRYFPSFNNEYHHTSLTFIIFIKDFFMSIIASWTYKQ